MIGLVNSAGAPEASRIQSAGKAGSEKEGAKELAPLLSDERAVKKVLDKAVEALQFANPDGQRGLPDGDASDRFDQADNEQRPLSNAGNFLDVVT